jgi:hypothetical protein
MSAERLRILFASPAWWPAVAFGGPIWVARELTKRLAARGHDVEVVTTSLVDLHAPASARSRVAEVDGVRIHYLATPLRYRWMGITPALPLRLPRRRHDRERGLGAVPRDPVCLRATRDVQAAAPQDRPQARP